ncbi:MAG TPA: helix-turn-helix domain-containing protein [Duganella sp.]|uniref:helix-turn-helix domain-containing protein n=1 Tax=Duganella sp. TaxID=1904440 RepID=UPI002ED4EFAE
MIAPAPALTHASTEPVPPGERLAYWDHYNAAALIGLRTTSQSRSGLLVSEVNTTLATMRVAEIKGNEHTIERCQRMVDLYPKESVFACHLVKGSAFFLQNGVTHMFHAGDTLVYDTRLPYVLGFLSEAHQLLIDIPVAELREWWGMRIDDLPLKIQPAGGLSAALGAELRRSLKSYLHAPSFAASISVPASVHTLLRAMAQPHVTGGGTVHQSIFHILAAKNYIAQQLSDPDLCPETVAKKVGVSVRHLNRLFAAEGRSVTEHIWALRASMAYRDLTSRGPKPSTIGEIAFRWGYSSQAHFCRAIAGRYGLPPSALRKAGVP